MFGFARVKSNWKLEDSHYFLTYTRVMSTVFYQGIFLNSLDACNTSGSRMKGLEQFFVVVVLGVAQTSRSLMAEDAVGAQVSHLLSVKGLVGKKLAVFSLNDADAIATPVCKDLGVICELQHVDCVKRLIREAHSAEPIAKRLRGDDSLDPFHFQLLEDRASNLQTKDRTATFQSVDDVEFSDVRASRRAARHAEPCEERFKKEAGQKEFWSRELYKELKRMNAPALEHLEHCVSDSHIHLALAGRTRYSTLKRYIKTWRSFQQWQAAVRGEAGSPEVGDLVEYIFCRYDEPCGPTVPPLIVKAVVWMERTACLDERARIGESHVVGSVRDYVVEMLSKDSAPTKRAPRYPVVMMEAFEHVVEDENQLLGIRVVSWVKLVKLWGTMRWDDVQKMVPKELKYFGGRMTTVLRTTKTTGPTKRVRELPVCISEHAYISKQCWLKTGFDLLKNHADFDRDYLLPKLNSNWTGFRKVMATYNDISSYSAYLRRKVMRPGQEELVIHPTLAAFWTEHSERATLPTGLALLRAPKEERDMLGRWKPDGSDTYLRMYNGVVSRLQLQFAKIARTNERFSSLDERDILESAMSWITDRCEPLSDERVRMILEHLEKSMKGATSPDWQTVEEEPFEIGSLFGPLTEDTLDVEVVDTNNTVERKEQRLPMFVVVNNGSKCKRLHRSRGGCWMGREITSSHQWNTTHCQILKTTRITARSVGRNQGRRRDLMPRRHPHQPQVPEVLIALLVKTANNALDKWISPKWAGRSKACRRQQKSCIDCNRKWNMILL